MLHHLPVRSNLKALKGRSREHDSRCLFPSRSTSGILPSTASWVPKLVLRTVPVAKDSSLLGVVLIPGSLRWSGIEKPGVTQILSSLWMQFSWP
eukprot:2451148-Amphidinium_carterae.1